MNRDRYGNDNQSLNGLVLGLVVVVLAGVVWFFASGGPVRFGSQQSSQTNVNVPAQQQPQVQPQQPNINIPDRIDVNINQNPATPVR